MALSFCHVAPNNIALPGDCTNWEGETNSASLLKMNNASLKVLVLFSQKPGAFQAEFKDQTMILSQLL